MLVADRLAAAMRGTLGSKPGTVELQSRWLELEFSAPLPAHLDGNSVTFEPPMVRFEVLPDLDAHTIGGGFQWRASPTMALDLALGGTFYDDDSYVDSSLGTPIEVEYEKRVLFLAVGLDFKF